jgi:uncharacterized membrane protein
MHATPARSVRRSRWEPAAGVGPPAPRPRMSGGLLIVAQSVPSPFLMNWAPARRGLAAAELAWTASIVAAAYAVSHTPGGSLAHGLAAICYAIGRFICHQRPERSFHLWAVPLPVCARCTGIYAGAAVAAVAPGLRRVSRPAWLLAACACPAAATLVFEWTTGIAPSNALRSASGLVAGAAVMAVLLGELRGE